jgi:hypothetical protein
MQASILFSYNEIKIIKNKVIKLSRVNDPDHVYSELIRSI